MNENESCAIYPSTHEALSLAGCRCLSCPTFTRRAYSNGIGVFICVSRSSSPYPLFFLPAPPQHLAEPLCYQFTGSVFTVVEHREASPPFRPTRVVGGAPGSSEIAYAAALRSIEQGQAVPSMGPVLGRTFRRTRIQLSCG